MHKSLKLNGILNMIQKTCNIIFPLIIFPYVSRVLGPEGYGKFSFANSINSYLLLITMLGINSYAIREGAMIRQHREKISKFASEITSINLISLMISYALLLILIIFNKRLNGYSNELLILSITLVGYFAGREWINTVYEDYWYITIRYIIIQIIGLILVFAFVRNSDDYIVYTIIYSFTSSAGYFINLIYTKKYVGFSITLRPQVKKHLKPILILFCSQLAISIYFQADITMLGFMKTEHEVGVYTVSSRIYSLAKSLINALTMVTIPRVALYIGEKKKEQADVFLNKLFDYLMVICIPSAIGLFIYSKTILRIIGGNEYLEGENSLRLLSMALAIAVISGFFCNAVLVPYKKEMNFMIITVLAAISNVVLNYFIIPQKGIVGAALTTLISEIIVLVLSWQGSRTVFNLKINKRNIVSIIIAALGVIISCDIVNFILSDEIMRLGLSICVSTIVYIILLWLLKNSVIREEVIKILHKIKSKPNLS